MSSCRDADDIGKIVRAWIKRTFVIVYALTENVTVTSRGYKQHVALAMFVNGIRQSLRIASTAPAIARCDDIDAAIFHNFEIL